MVSPRKQSSFTSFDDILALVEPGGHVVVCFADAYLARTIVRQLRASSRKIRKFHIVTGSHESSSDAASAEHPVGALKSSGEALRVLRSLPSKKLPSVLIDFSSDIPPWQGSTALRERFLGQAVAALAEKKAGSLWLYSESLLPPEGWTKVKDRADAFVAVRSAGTLHFIQLVSARGRYEPDLFLPRPLQMEEGNVRFGDPVRPSDDNLEPSDRVLRLQERLKHSEEVRARTFQEFPYPQVVFSARKLIEANRAFRARFPWVTAEAAEKMTPHAFFGKSNISLVRQMFPPAGQTTPEKQDEVRVAQFRMEDGRTLECEVRPLAVPDTPSPTFLITFFDITDRQARQKSADAARDFLSGLLESSAGAVAFVQNGKFAYVNRGFLEVLGYLLAEDLLGKEFVMCVQSRDRRSVAEKLDPDSREPGVVEQIDVQCTRYDGSTVGVGLSLQTLSLESGTGTVCYLRDRSGELQADEEKRRKAWETETLDQMMIALRDHHDVGAVCQASVHQSLKRLDYDGAGLYLVSDDRTSLGLAAWEDLPEKIVGTLAQQSLVEGVTGYVSKTLEPTVLKISEYPAYLPHRSLFEGEQLAVVTFVPLMAGDILEGLLILCSRRQPDASSLSLRLLHALARHMGSALGTARRIERVSRLAEQYQSAVESIRDVVYQASPTGALNFIGPNVEKIVGYTAAEIMRTSDAWRNIVHPDDRSEYSRRMSSSGLGEEGVDLVYRVLPKGKAGYRWVRDSVRYRRDVRGGLAALNGIIADITEQIQRERLLERSEEDLRSIVESVQEGLVAVNGDLRCTFWNTALEKLTGESREQIIGKGMEDIPLPFDEFSSLLRRAMEGEFVQLPETPFVSPLGSRRLLLSGWCVHMKGREGSVRGAVATVRYRDAVQADSGEAIQLPSQSPLSAGEE